MLFFRRFSKRILIVTNIVLAILFLLGSYPIYFDPQRWWFFGLLTLCLPYLLLLLLTCFVIWVITRKIWMLITLLVILIAWNPVRNILPLNFSSAFNKQK